MSFGQNSLSDLDSTNYKELLMNIDSVDNKLRERFVGRDYQSLVEIIGNDYYTVYDNSVLIFNENLTKRKYSGLVYHLGMDDISYQSSGLYYLVSILKKDQIKDIYVICWSILWINK